MIFKLKKSSDWEYMEEIEIDSLEDLLLLVDSLDEEIIISHYVDYSQSYFVTGLDGERRQAFGVETDQYVIEIYDYYRE